MNYAQAVEDLYALAPEMPAGGGDGASRRKFDLAHMRVLCAELGDPQTRVPSVLIAGTNGKGSTAATLASILAAAGYRTGLYTSPHLIRVNERVQTTAPFGQFIRIADEDFARHYTAVANACERLVADQRLQQTPSFFERMTAVAFLHFAESAEVMVLEVGLGGRLDATNVVEPMVSVITDISLDHQEYLGDTIAEIAREKCGILRNHGTMVTLSQHPEANQAIGEVATRLGVRAINAADYLPPAIRNQERLADAGLQPNRYQLSTLDGTLEIDSPLAGDHQQRNLALAIATAIELRTSYGYKITNAALAQGIRNTRWPGRLESIGTDLLLDVAHNPAGAWTLRSAIAALDQARPRTLIFSCLSDKNLTEMSRILFPLFDSSADGDPARRRDHLILAPIRSHRAASVENLLEAAHALGVPAHAAPHLAGALAQARSITPGGGLIVATGSVYLVGEIREMALEAAMVPA